MKRSILLAAVFAVTNAVYAEDTVPDKNPFSGDAAAIKKGMREYRSNCFTCHGPKAEGDGPHAPPNTANLRKFNKGFKNFVRIVREGVNRSGTVTMPPWGGVLDNETVHRIGAHLETLALPTANWK